MIGLHHGAISTQDLERLVEFYVEHFGCVVAYRGGWKQGSVDSDRIMGLVDSAATIAVLRLPSFGFLELFQFDSPRPAGPKVDRPVCDYGITHLCFRVADIEETYERMRERGVHFHTPPVVRADGAHIATYGRDPDGNVFELLEIVAESHPFGGPAPGRS